jgi:mannose-6-phosphate isomerase
MTINQFLILQPEYRDYVWGGSRLRPGVDPTAEAWMVYEQNKVLNHPFAARSLSELASEYGPDLLGSHPYSRTGRRFPLLIKLLDCADWLSLQVHPDDQQAVELEGPGHFGKTEAWYVLEADPQARLVAGLKAGLSARQLEDAIRGGTILEHALTLDVQAGDTIFMPPGTIHALGPGLLIYEVQETSDLTYRVWDWGRPQTEKRRLHIEKSLEVARPDATAQVVPPPNLADGSQIILVQCPYFTLELLASQEKPIQADTKRESFHALTVIEGTSLLLSADGAEIVLEKFQTALVPAGLGRYTIFPRGKARLLKSSVEP